MFHQDDCSPFAAVLGDHIIRTPTDDEARTRPYAISDGKTYAPISDCPFCGRGLMRSQPGIMGYAIRG